MKEKYYHTKETVQEYLELSKDVDSLEIINELKKHLPPDAILLELGSGPGKDWKILSEKYKVIGSDVSDVFLEYLRNQNPNGKFIKTSAEKIDAGMRFDGIYSNKVLHHLTDDELKKSVQSQLSVLESNGVICHSFWHGKGSEEFKGMFVNYHDSEDLLKVFGESFVVLLLKRYKEFERGDSILLIGRKK